MDGRALRKGSGGEGELRGKDEWASGRRRGEGGEEEGVRWTVVEGEGDRKRERERGDGKAGGCLPLCREDVERIVRLCRQTFGHQGYVG